MSLKYQITYAQNLEDRIIEAILKKQGVGFYVDVGASDPVEDSVTKLFYDMGWSGINIEPSAGAFSRLKKLRSRDINLNVAASSQNGEISLRTYSLRGLHTASRATMDQNLNDERLVEYRDVSVPSKTLTSIFEEYNVSHIDFLKIDVEGFELEVLSGLDLNTWRPSVICIEADHKREDWTRLILEKNYTCIHNDGLNEYYVDSKEQDLISNFSYPKDIITGKLFLKRRVVERLRSDAKKIDRQRDKLSASMNESDALREQLVSAKQSYASAVLRQRLIKARLADVERRVAIIETSQEGPMWYLRKYIKSSLKRLRRLASR